MSKIASALVASGTLLLALAGDASAAAAPKAVLAAARARLSPPADVPGVSLTLRGVRYAPNQASRPDVAIAEVEARQSMLILRDGRFRLETDTLYPGAIRFRFLGVGSPTGSATVDRLRWRDGDEISRDDAAGARQDFADFLFLSPGLLLDDAAARAPALSTDDRTGDVVAAFQDGAGRPATLIIDPATGLVKAATSGSRRYIYDGYRSTGRLSQPARIAVFNGDRATVRWDDVTSAVATPDDRAFAIPAGYVEAIDRGPPRAVDLGHGAYRVDGTPSGYHTGFVVGADAVAVFDAPISPTEADKVKAVIEATAPGRRLAYVVVSHTHGDHVAGLPTYLKAGAIALTGTGGGGALRRQFPDLPPTAVQEVAAPRTLDLGGGVTVVAYPLASHHAAEMLVGWAPASGTVFQGDLFYLPEVGPTPAAFEGGEDLARLIADRRLKVTDIVGVHGRSGRPEDLAEGVRLRNVGG
jgi:glyoxylase-like metal-dependent hydrolase (beta-lactamase superfamily II)